MNDTLKILVTIVLAEDNRGDLSGDEEQQTNRDDGDGYGM
jgi:hypothetical protein